MRRGAARLALLLCALLACSEEERPLTELIVVVDSDLSVPGELDQIVVTTVGPGDAERDAEAILGKGEVALPRYLALAHEQGALGPIAVRVEGKLQGATVLERQVEVSFVSGRSLVLPLHLARQCLQLSCEQGETCSEHGCQPVAVDMSELSDWDGHKPTLDGESELDAGGTPGDPDAGDPDERDAGGEQDAGMSELDAGGSASEGGTSGSDAGGQCMPRSEICNGADDNCDGTIDEGFDFATDVNHCGGCGIACNTRRGDVCCVGVCTRTCSAAASAR